MIKDPTVRTTPRIVRTTQRYSEKFTAQFDSDDRIEAEVRVKSCTIKPFDYSNNGSPLKVGECLEIKAEGFWVPKDLIDTPMYPLSLHFTVYPGCGVVPVIGDNIQVTVERLKH